MTITVEQLKRVKTVTVPFGEESITLRYVPRRWDVIFVERHNALIETETDGGHERYVYTLLTVLDGWDVMEAGEAAAISEDLLHQFDDGVLLMMYLAVRKDLEAAEEKKSS